MAQPSINSEPADNQTESTKPLVTRSEAVIFLASAALAVGGGLSLLPKSGLDAQNLEYTSSMWGPPDFKSLPMVEPSALEHPTYDSTFKPCVEWDVNGTTSLAQKFQFVGDISFLKGVSLESGNATPDFHVYNFDLSKENAWGPRVLIKPENDPVKLIGDHAKVHLAGHICHGWRTRHGGWRGDTEGKADGMVDGTIIVVDYLKVLPKD